MSIPAYEYTVDQCDVPEVRRAALVEYRTFRRKCLEYMRGDAPTSVMNQVHDLAWHTCVFRVLNEARGLEPHRAVNGAMWELITAGYASVMTMGIRRLVDRDTRTDSVWNVIAEVQKRPELLTREKFLCYDGLPFDHVAARNRYLAGRDVAGLSWLPNKGPEGWAVSEQMDAAFNRLAPHAVKRKRTDMIDPALLVRLKTELEHSSIQTVCTLADKRYAHAERLAEGSAPVPVATYADVDDALRRIVRVANFLSSHFFYDAAFGSVVPTPQFDVLDSLDEPWITTANLDALHKEWEKVANAMDEWAYDTDKGFLPADPKAG